MTLYVAPVVEGHTEVLCVGSILHAIWVRLLAASDRLQVLDATRGERSSLLSERHPSLGDKVEEAHTKLRHCLRKDPLGRTLILLLIDAEEECPKALARSLLARAQAVRSDATIACVMPNRMLENWFKAAARSLSGVCGLPAELPTPTDAELGSGDTWLTGLMTRTDPNRPYKKRSDALTFARRMDPAECLANSRSFKKLVDELKKRLPPEPPCTAPA